MAFRRIFFWLAVMAAGPVVPAAAMAGGLHEAILYKDPACGCCADYAAYLRRNGFDVTIVDTGDLAAVKANLGVPPALAGCHSVVVDGYVVEGHVPVSVLGRLVSERPDIKGVSLPGMPAGSPGMSGQKSAPFTIYEISGGAPRVFAID